MTIQIEKGIPVPRGIGAGRGLSKEGAALRAMEVDDSFVTHLSAVRLASYWRGLRPKRFTAQTQPDGTVRVWRIE